MSINKNYVFLILLIIFSACSTTSTSTNSNTKRGEHSTLSLEVQLMNAAERGDISTMKSLIDSGANINFQTQDKTYPLYSFVVDGYKKNTSNESLNFIKWLVEEKGADYKKSGYNNYSLVHVSQDVELTKYLVSIGLSINSLTTNNATTLMGSLASSNDIEENIFLQEYLINHCVDLKQVASFGSQELSALDFAKKFKKTKALRLIKNAIDSPPVQCQGEGILAPVISFYNTPDTYDSENVNISIKIEAQGFGVGDIVIFINGIETSSNKDRGLKVKRGGLRVRTFNIKLPNGLSQIKVYAYDSSNTVKSNEIFHEVVAEYKSKSKPKLYALAIGIDEFEKKSLNLRYAQADASLFGTTLFKRSRALFSEVNIEYLRKSQNTTKKAIIKRLKELKSISANDFFVFYLATHGVVIDDKYYMITSNINSIEPNYIKKNAISEDELKEAFKNIPTANKLLLFDTCYSGSINDKVSKALAESTIKKLNITSMTAANSVQTALEGIADGHGIFTYIISDALDGEADINQDGIVQSMELVNYTNRMVPIEAKKFNHIQEPAYFQSGQIFNISKLRTFKGTINMQPQYFEPKEIKKLVSYMNNNDISSLNEVLKKNKVTAELKIKKIKTEAAKNEAKKAAKIMKTAEKNFKFGKHKFIFNDNSIFLNIQDKIKKHFNFTDSEGRHLVVFDFYSTDPAPRVIETLDTQKVSKIYMADRGDWYRVTLQTKSKQGYQHIITKEGIFIKLKNIYK